jgi:hypothetical protein
VRDGVTCCDLSIVKLDESLSSYTYRPIVLQLPDHHLYVVVLDIKLSEEKSDMLALAQKTDLL